MDVTSRAEYLFGHTIKSPIASASDFGRLFSQNNPSQRIIRRPYIIPRFINAKNVHKAVGKTHFSGQQHCDVYTYVYINTECSILMILPWCSDLRKVTQANAVVFFFSFFNFSFYCQFVLLKVCFVVIFVFLSYVQRYFFRVLS